MKKVIEFILKHKYIIFIIILYIFFFIQMQFVHFYGDDFNVLYPINSLKSINNVFSFCLQKMSWFWSFWSGRIAGHFIVSFGLSLFGIQFFRILNPIMIFIMIYLCLKIFELFRKFDFIKCLFYISLIVVSFNVYISREILYWAYAGILYVWGFNLTLIVIYIIYKKYLQDAKFSLKSTLLLSFICFFQTFILEQFAFLLIAFLGLILIKYIKNHNIKNLKYILILLMITITGLVISTIAPGNYIRTKPLYEEIIGYSMLEIVLGKTHLFFNTIFDIKLCGIYLIILMILSNIKYFKTVNIKKNMKSILPSLLIFSYIIIIIINNVFRQDFLLFYELLNYDAMYSIRYLTIFGSIIIIVYYVLLSVSFFYIIFKTINTKHKFLFYALIVTFFVSLIPIIVIRYCGTRYYLFYLMSIILVIVNYLLDLKEMSMKLSIKKNICIFVYSILFIIVIKNISLNFIGYYKNSKIYDYNDNVLKSNIKSNTYIISEIPYEDSLYSWQTNVTDYTGNHDYYDFYLQDFYEDYYGIPNDNIKVIH